MAERGEAAKASAPLYYATIPLPQNFTPEERELYESGEYPIRLARYLPPHEHFLDYLVERSLEAWTRSRG